MRNLKKVLALALATVMLLGMMAMASAADFNDEDQIADQYDVAVDVMQTIGVFNGSKGYLNPKSTLTRAEAAKVITYLALTKANADKLGVAEAPFADVEADNWAAGSIAYAKNLGIVSGNAGNYRPADTLTGYEFAKMLLVVLGYNADTEGYKGAGWDNNVNVDALTAGLLNGLATDLAQPILREEAAQMAFNALKAVCVYYEGGSKITAGDVSFEVNAVRKEYAEVAEDAYIVNGTNDGKMNLVEKLYKDISLDVATENAFGLATKSWKKAGVTAAIATEANYTVLATYEGTAATVTKGALYDVVGEMTLNTYVNGGDATNPITVTKAGFKGSSAVAGLGNAGSLVQVVKNNGVKEVVVKAYLPAKVTKVTEATAAVERYVTVDVYTAAGTVEKTITTTAYAKDQYILVALNGAGTVIGNKAAETAYGTLTQVKGINGSTVSALYLDGVSIPVANGAVATKFNAVTSATDGLKTATYSISDKYTVYMDNGYAVAAIADAAAKPTMKDVVYAYAGGTPKDIYGNPATYDMASVIYMDGTKADIKLEAGEYAKIDATANDKGVFQIADANADGEYTLTNMTSLTAVYGTEPFGAFQANGLVKAATSVATTGTKAYYTADTKVLSYNTTTKAVTVAEVPAAVTFGTETWVIYSQASTGGAYEVEMIITDATSTLAISDLYYVVGTEIGSIYVADKKDTYNQYNVYSLTTGEKSTVLAKSASTGFAGVKVDALGIATFDSYTTYATADNANGLYKITAQDSDLYGNLFSVDGEDDLGAAKKIDDRDASAAVVIDLDTSADAVDLTVAKLAGKDATFTGFAYVKDAKVVAIVVTGFTKATT